MMLFGFYSPGNAEPLKVFEVGVTDIRQLQQDLEFQVKRSP